jgi:hypothetical protein
LHASAYDVGQSPHDLGTKHRDRDDISGADGPAPVAHGAGLRGIGGPTDDRNAVCRACGDRCCGGKGPIARDGNGCAAVIAQREPGAGESGDVAADAADEGGGVDPDPDPPLPPQDVSARSASMGGKYKE